MPNITIPIDELVVRMGHNSHISIEYHRGSKWSEYVYLEPSGPSKGKMLTAKYHAEFYRVSDIPIKRAAQSLLGASHRAYSFNQAVFDTIMGVYIMNATNGNTKGLESLSNAALVPVHNELAAALGAKQIGVYKGSKRIILAKIEALQQQLANPTLAQSLAATAAAAKAAKRLAGLPKKSDKENDMAAKKPTTAKAAKAAKPTPKTAEKPAAPKMPCYFGAAGFSAAPKKQGIGAFCIALIREGKDNAAVLAAVAKKFPDAATSAASIAWYRNKVKNGEV